MLEFDLLCTLLDSPCFIVMKLALLLVLLILLVCVIRGAPYGKSECVISRFEVTWVTDVSSSVWCADIKLFMSVLS